MSAGWTVASEAGCWVGGGAGDATLGGAGAGVGGAGVGFAAICVATGVGVGFPAANATFGDPTATAKTIPIKKLRNILFTARPEKVGFAAATRARIRPTQA